MNEFVDKCAVLASVSTAFVPDCSILKKDNTADNILIYIC